MNTVQAKFWRLALGFAGEVGATDRNSRAVDAADDFCISAC